VRGLGFEFYVCQLCVVVLLLIFNNMYEYGIGIVNLSCLELWPLGCWTYEGHFAPFLFSIVQRTPS